ncbi:MAG TPA: LamG-like jellyroll fold domain-containing protein [Acidobacteriaceae bacterium]|nr:LamG-like jellyroll fold domain-containing protein [Acidobacteriaceae bacterium]
MAQTTAIRAPTNDTENHTIILRQLKEAAEVGRRIRGNPLDSFAQVGELVNAGIVRLVNNQLVAPSPSSLPASAVPSTRKVSTAGSLTGGGALATDLTLQLVNDTAAPGNSMVYGTNASGVKGWYASSGGGGGSSTLAGLSDVSISSPSNGQVLTYNSSTSKWDNANSGTTVATPGTISDLVFWWESDNILATTGQGIYAFQDRTPWYGVGAPCGTAGMALANSSGLNGLPTVNFGTGGAWYTIPGSAVLTGVTIFSVFNTSAPAGPVSIIGSTGGSGIVFRIWSNHMNVLVDLVGGGGSSSATVSANTWYQGNVTYVPSTGVYAFRQGRAAAGSGTGPTASATATMNRIGSGASGENFQGQLAAVIVYNRVLTTTEITNVENYLNAKWGV